MPEDLFIRALRGAGLEHDVDLFLQRFRHDAGRFPLVILGDSPDEARSSEAMLPALRYMAGAGIGVLVLSGYRPSRAPPPSFSERLAGIGLFTEHWSIVEPGMWTLLSAGPRGTIAHAVLSASGAPATLMSRLVDLGCRKLVVLDTQGIVDLDGLPAGVLTVEEDEGRPSWLDRVDPRQREAAGIAAGFAAPAEDHDVSVSLASPINLLAELFTVRGSGTLFRPPARFEAFIAPDPREAEMVAVVERAFGRTLRNPGFAAAQDAHVILEGHRRAAAVLMSTPLGHYMSKFAVIREAQGTGLGAELWDRVCARAPQLFWRSKNGNPINSWYARVADGMHRQRPWTYFWRGLGFGEAEAACFFAAKLPEDFT